MRKIQIVMNPTEYKRVEVHSVSLLEAIRIWLHGLVIVVQVMPHINCMCVTKPYFERKEGADNER